MIFDLFNFKYVPKLKVIKSFGFDNNDLINITIGFHKIS